ncbi:MAG: ABC transporter ATP-binding protein, partial [Candidatus Bipolaricaulaceae bacterium]
MKVRIRGLSLAYSAVPVLDGVDLAVQEGEILAVVGPNGAGKSTLLRAISGALRPQKGVIYLDFRVVWDFSARERAQKLAMVEQGAQPAFDLTVQELVELGRLPHLGRLQGFRAADAAAVAQALAFTGLAHLAHRRWSELSGGERQRALLAMALAQEPEVLLLDEPTAHLDVAHQIELMQLITGFAGKGGTAILALHDLNLAAAFAHRVALLCRGRLLACGTPAEVLTPALLREAFGVEALVRTHPLTGRVHVHFLLNPPRAEKKKGRILVLGGGGSVEDLLPHLAAEFAVTLGVVAALDSDYQVAQALGIPVITEAPFSPISDAAYAELCRSIEEAEAVVVGPTWFGPGNLRMLEALVGRSRGK